ncbi:hypothetical protein CK231_20085 [Mesorhizobium loti]|uniref:Uncharacterized protein n=3 Tax=Mesorhizobium TaxID=68287 RepID=A0A1A5J8T4_RHILI|nr:hypothetical protein BAE42_20725 [Mesorhizobium loti]QGX78984.1 hypothetical protein EB234_20435 [Mesorhizobium japonicum R7A]RNJ45581.1 hypothetical protein DNR46_08815 [Mesorhizobium japonicum]RXT46897.1 hypothetical protein B5V01_09665 [Mesorhizobium erdmanii]OBP72847.1 hypothetical protein BAE39_20170 [Mesorhizobium loti]
MLLTARRQHRRPLIGVSLMIRSRAHFNDSDQRANKLNHIVRRDGCLVGILPNVLGGRTT